MNITTSLHISLPDTLKQFVKERVEQEHFSNPSNYIRALIREDQKRPDSQKLESMLLEGLASGHCVALGTQEWNYFWQKLKRASKRKRNRYDD